MNKIIAISRTKGSPRWKTKMIAYSSTPELSLYKSSATSMSWISTSDECKECSPEKLNKETYEDKIL
jgi:hypothetical protein